MSHAKNDKVAIMSTEARGDARPPMAPRAVKSLTDQGSRRIFCPGDESEWSIDFLNQTSAAAEPTYSVRRLGIIQSNKV